MNELAKLVFLRQKNVRSQHFSNTFDAEQPGVPFSRGYNPVDVKL